MKNALLMVAAMGMIGGAFAASRSVRTDVTATVVNVCTYNNSMTDAQDEVQPFPNSTTLGSYDAVHGLTGTYDNYIYRCTKGTPFSSVVGDSTGSANGKVTLTSTSSTDSLTGSVTVTDALSNPDTATTQLGDVHKGTLHFTFPVGQFNTSAGGYSGSVYTTVTYN